VKGHEAAALGELCAGRDMAIVADEVFLDFADARAEPQPTFALHEACLTFTLSGLSKISALPQMKLAWLAVSGPDALAQAALARLEIIADTYLSPGTPVQIAADKLLGTRANLQKQLKVRIGANLGALDALLAVQTHAMRLEREGGWYVILRVPATRPDEDLAIAVLEKCGVLAHPGRFFDFSQDGFLVLSLIAREKDFAEGTRRILEFVNLQQGA
jgi:aspartate/methionine/tyrosine aminotransferase